MRGYIRFVSVLAGIAVLDSFYHAQAAPGDLDPNFGVLGKVTTSISFLDDYGLGVALQADGKIVAAGYSGNPDKHDFSLVRYNPEGSLDFSFGVGGKVTTPVGPADDQGGSLVIQPDDKIVAAGDSSDGSKYDFALVRYDPNGTIDPSFGTRGKVMTSFGPATVIGAKVALQSDGKIVVAGVSLNGGKYGFALARYNKNGSLDGSFGTGGTVSTPIGVATGPSNDVGGGMAVQPDGRIVVSGRSWNGSRCDFALVRYGANGFLDASFGIGGKVTTPIGPSDDHAESVVLQPDGKIIVAGYSSNGVKYDLALVRYNTNGSLDLSFGTGGKVTTPIGAYNDWAEGVALQPDGKIVAAGRSSDGHKVDFALRRYNPDGSLDSSFGTGGKVTTSFGPFAAVAYNVILQPDGKIVAGGMSHNSGKWEFALARYEGFTPKPHKD